MRNTNRLSHILFIFGVLSLVVLGKDLPCQWQSPSTGEKYDFSSLYKKDGYQIKDSSNTMGMFDLFYVTNVCETVGCQGVDVSVYEGLQILGEITQNCDIMTNANEIVYDFVNNDNPKVGVQWTYRGDTCILPPTISYDDQGNIKTTPNASTDIKTSTFQVICSEDQSSNWTVDTTDTCHLKFTMQSPYGCEGAARGSYASFKILIFIILLAGIYFAGGSYINKRKYGLTGVESLPNHSFWTDFPYLINDGFKLTLLKTTSAIRYFKAKGATSSSEQSSTGTYNTI
ncbi:hypothetical protein ABPG74_006440 [Tetrahymena malaccensis]